MFLGHLVKNLKVKKKIHTEPYFFSFTIGELPVLRSSNDIDKTKPLPTSLQSDFIPEDILFALTQPPPGKGKLGPPSRVRNLNTTSVRMFERDNVSISFV